MSTTIDPRTTLSQELAVREVTHTRHNARQAHAAEKLAEQEPPPPPPPSPRVPIAGVLLDSLA